MKQNIEVNHHHSMGAASIGTRPDGGGRPDMRSGLRTEDRRQWQNGGERDARLIGRKGSTYLAPNLKTTLNVVKSESKFPLDNKLVLKLF